MKSPAILVVVNNSWGEVDWILPVLKELKEKRDARTWIYFTFEQTLEEAVEYRDLCARLPGIIQDCYSPSRVKRGLGVVRQIRELMRIGRAQRFGPYRLARKVGSILRGRFHAMFTAPELLRLKLPGKVDYIFHDFSGVDFSSYYRAFPEARVVVFPHGTFQYGQISPELRQELKRSLAYRTIPREALLLVGSPDDVPYFRDLTGLARIEAVGYPKLDDAWVRTFAPGAGEKTSVSGRKGTLLYLLIPKRKISGEGVFEKTVESVIEVAAAHHLRLLIKKHPRQGEYEIEPILARYPGRDIALAETSVLHAAFRSDLAVCFPTSACMDALAAGIPVIEYFDYSGQRWATLASQAGESTSVYRINNYVLPAGNREVLEEEMRSILTDAEYHRRIVTQQREASDRNRIRPARPLDAILFD